MLILLNMLTVILLTMSLVFLFYYVKQSNKKVWNGIILNILNDDKNGYSLIIAASHKEEKQTIVLKITDKLSEENYHKKLEKNIGNQYLLIEKVNKKTGEIEYEHHGNFGFWTFLFIIFTLGSYGLSNLF